MRLVDRFAEIISYTEYLTQNLRKNPQDADIEKINADYEALYKDAEAGAEDKEGYDSAKFAVCAWVDERILCSGWADAHKWVKHQLQRKFFSTTNAGEEFFKRLDNLSEDAVEAKEVFVYCLSLGFTGRYFTEDDRKRLNTIRRESFQAVSGTDTPEIPEVIFPETQAMKDRSGRKSKYGLTISVFIAIALPPAVFAVLYYLYDSSLNKIMNSYFGF